MDRSYLAIGVLVLTAACAGNGTSQEEASSAPERVAAADSPAAHTAPAGAAPALAQDPALPADAEHARARLDASPRHGEWAVVRSGGDSIRAWVVYPERSDRAPVVLVVHEIYGLTNWIRAVADQLAAEGFIAIAPDLMTMHDVPHDTAGDPVRDRATAVIRTLDRADIHRHLKAVADWGMALPAARPSYGIVGFCWGGSTTFVHAIESADVRAAVVYYGSSPNTAELNRVSAPVLGLYGGADARVNATIPPADSALKALGKTYEPHLFDGAGHGFLRQQGGQDGANLRAGRQAWPLTVAWFRRYL